MSLKKSAHKIQSSIATYFFAHRDLLYMTSKFDWRELSKIPAPLVRNEKEYKQLIDGVRIAVLKQHTEIVKQGFYE